MNDRWSGRLFGYSRIITGGCAARRRAEGLCWARSSLSNRRLTRPRGGSSTPRTHNFPGPLVLWAGMTRPHKREGRSSIGQGHPSQTHSDARLPTEVSEDRGRKGDQPEPSESDHLAEQDDVCLFVGVHCHQSNIALKIIRGGTDCFTIALCTFNGTMKRTSRFVI